MKTTLYGNGKSVNEFGTPKVAKETNFVHGNYIIKYPVSLGTMRDLVGAFHQEHGHYPSTLYVTTGSIGTRYVRFRLLGPDQGPSVGLDIIYDAPELRVA